MFFVFFVTQSEIAMDYLVSARRAGHCFSSHVIDGSQFYIPNSHLRWLNVDGSPSRHSYKILFSPTFVLSEGLRNQGGGGLGTVDF